MTRDLKPIFVPFCFKPSNPFFIFIDFDSNPTCFDRALVAYIMVPLAIIAIIIVIIIILRHHRRQRHQPVTSITADEAAQEDNAANERIEMAEA